MRKRLTLRLQAGPCLYSVYVGAKGAGLVLVPAFLKIDYWMFLVGHLRKKSLAVPQTAPWHGRAGHFKTGCREVISF
jgi:hypothetical protein